tara:strand:+ start:525 stop:692 length:168 start_codon:yes stop_codon:yes gene_type:complete
MAKEKVKRTFNKPVKYIGASTPLQWNVKKDTEEFKKVRPKDVFEGYTSNNNKKKK